MDGPWPWCWGPSLGGRFLEVSDPPWKHRLGSWLLLLCNPKPRAEQQPQPAWPGRDSWVRLEKKKKKKKIPLALFWGERGMRPPPRVLGAHRSQPRACSPSSAFICSCPSRVMRGAHARGLGRSWDVGCGAASLVALRAPGCLCGHSTASGYGATGLLRPWLSLCQHEAGSAHSLAGLPSSAARTSQQVPLPTGSSLPAEG